MSINGTNEGLPEYTGRLLVTGRPHQGKETIQSLKNTTGLSIASSRDFADQAVTAEALAEGDGIYFDEIGVTVVTPGSDDQVSRLAGMEAFSADDDAPIVEPERYVYAMNEQFGEYLRGFRDAVNQVSNTYLGSMETGDEPDEADIDVLANGSTWGLQKTRVVVGFPLGQSWSGAGIKIAVLDTGMDLGHPDFAGRSIISQSFVPNEAVQDFHSHGTHCIGTACGPKEPTDQNQPRYGVAHQAQIFAGKVLSNAGSGADGWILGGINWAIANHCHVVSMSLGAATSASGFSAAYEAAAQAGLSAGTLIIAAAGNDGGRPVSHPANCPSIMAVGAVDQALGKAGFSNITFFPPHGKVDIVGPGVGTLSSVPVSHGKYGTKSGTSMATPHVAGIAALHAQSNAAYRGAALWQRLVATALALSGQPANHVGAGLAQAPYRRLQLAPWPLPRPFPPVKIPPILRPVPPVPPQPNERAVAKSVTRGAKR
ncbi:S8 family serine peptidase [Rhizobium sp. WL3]|uniref:S8 family serine peptidase n=1 Tax=Rhizobium sp. WL3 TaxID=2603277 RepID=UPI001FEFB3F8|nr:S8 family serine peptidase [Rhizobium sp. WL3]